jgi:hypothetical protein
MLAEKMGATSVQLEMEVKYWFAGKMFDYVAMIPPAKEGQESTSVAVSVTRVLDNTLNAFSEDKARLFLKKKTDNMLEAARSMSILADTFVLHVWVPSHKVARECVKIARELTSALPDCTVWVTVCEEEDIYSTKGPGRGRVS